MKITLFTLLGAGALLNTCSAAASSSPAAVKPLTSCPGNEKLCFSVLVPPDSAETGAGDLYFQIQAPSSYEWAALGQGLEMAGSNIFIIYSDAANNNVTLSPRLGVSEIEPLYDASTKLELLAGSGIANGLMTANVRCTNCDSWNGGNMSLNDTTSSWIWAYKAGTPIGSDSMTTNLALHDDMGTLIFNLSQAVGGSDTANPFVASDGTSPPANHTTTPGASSSTSSSSSSGSSLSTTMASHGILMGATMLILFPCGALLRRVAPGSSIWAHAGIQSVALILTIAGAGLGTSIGKSTGQGSSSHALLGIAVTVLMALQPVWGLLQHRHFKCFGNRGAFGLLHQILGGGAILLGIVNGGLGLQLAGTIGSPGGNAYVLVAAILGSILLTMVIATVFAKRGAKAVHTKRRHRQWHKMENLSDVDLARTLRDSGRRPVREPPML